MTVSVVLP